MSAESEMIETVVVLTIKSAKPLPDDMRGALERRAYDWCNNRGVVIEVDSKQGYSLEVRTA